MTLKAKVHNGTLVLDQPLALPEGTEVELELHAAGIVPGPDAPIPTVYDRYQAFIGVATDLPSDLASNHDHYIYGAPKGIDSE